MFHLDLYTRVIVLFWSSSIRWQLFSFYKIISFLIFFSCRGLLHLSMSHIKTIVSVIIIVHLHLSLFHFMSIYMYIVFDEKERTYIRRTVKISFQYSFSLSLSFFFSSSTFCCLCQYIKCGKFLFVFICSFRL
jgi:hypothetical protein